MAFLIQDSMTYSANKVRSLFYLFKEILILVKYSFLFLVDHFWYFLLISGLYWYLLFRYPFCISLLSGCLLLLYFICNAGFSWNPFFDILFVFLDFLGTLLFDVLFLFSRFSWFLTLWDFTSFFRIFMVSTIFIHQLGLKIFRIVCFLICNIWCSVFNIYISFLFYTALWTPFYHVIFF